VPAGRTLSAAQQERLLAKIRKICLALPETSERLSHGEAAFFYREKKSFLNTDTYHHGASHYSVWVAAPLGAQDLLVRGDPEHFFVPPYVGHRGWVGLMLDTDPDWEQIERVITDGYAQVAAGKKR
jgi:predicted DNA-binding protein (MmcQ/YjbR family)